MAQLTRQNIKKPSDSMDWKQAVAAVLATKHKGTKNIGDHSTDPRINAQVAGEKLSTQVTNYWAHAKNAAPGPIRVMDMFSGCGGM